MASRKDRMDYEVTRTRNDMAETVRTLQARIDSLRDTLHRESVRCSELIASMQQGGDEWWAGFLKELTTGVPSLGIIQGQGADVDRLCILLNERFHTAQTVSRITREES